MSGALSMEHSQDKKEKKIEINNNLKNKQKYSYTDSKRTQVVLSLTRQSPRLGRKVKNEGRRRMSYGGQYPHSYTLSE